MRLFEQVVQQLADRFCFVSYGYDDADFHLRCRIKSESGVSSLHAAFQTQPFAAAPGRGIQPSAQVLCIVRQMTIRSSNVIRRSGSLYCVLRSEEHTSELQSLAYLVCRLLLEKKKQSIIKLTHE